ncbi:MAG: glutamine--fructose-6-phosphate transaminase (isomerizing) [Magnetococcales bacterium]|nr:glutamine--fructose-6-phosphate transaminase (isomerizing) [Magnetococcales bacterium]
MCGIIGVISERNVPPLLLEGLKRLEYRGYDSSGVATSYQGRLYQERAVGKLSQLEQRLMHRPVTGFVGIAHTRWATHGAPTEQNAHPQCSEQVAVVHNGIIENHWQLRQELEARGVQFHSETDTEVIPHLIEYHLHQGLEPEQAVRQAVQQLKGSFAIGVLFRQRDDLLIAARCGSPLIVGLGDGENFIASDATPLVPHTRQLVYLHDHDVAILTRSSVVITDPTGAVVARDSKYSHLNIEQTGKWPYRHFMQKEIFEQPAVIGETLRGLMDWSNQTIAMEMEAAVLDFAHVHNIIVIGCGTSWHAGLVGRYWIEQLAHIPVSVDIASEFRYRETPLSSGTLVVVISQSGETADTLAALRHVKASGLKVLAIVNVPESSIAREADQVILTRAGPEIGVASTKAFTTQLVALACLSLALGKARGCIAAEDEKKWITQLLALPAQAEQVLMCDKTIQAIAHELRHANGFLFLGRGGCFPIALEGALKLKEISYIHAEGYAAGEMKHGPIALIDEELPVVVVAPRDKLFDKIVSNIEEIRARRGRIVLFTTTLPPSDPLFQAGYLVQMVESGLLSAPILYVIPLQLLAYHMAVMKGTDVDQPRNLAKSVTVE